MQPEKLIIAEDKTVKEALESFKKASAVCAKVENSSGEILGVLLLKSLEAATAHKLDSYPVGLVVDYFELEPEALSSPDCEEIKNKIELLFPAAEKEAIFACSELAKELNVQVYLVGGPVRDLIRNEANLDLDLTLESNAIDFAMALANKYPGVKVKEKHPDFKTAKVLFVTGEKQMELDVASTRKEYYKQPGALPTINEIRCPLKEDLFRRDFTVNAMAAKIHPAGFGEIIDLYGGLADINTKELRVMHSLSFVDDPTRIVRGVKFAVRFGYKFSSATEKLIGACISSGLFDGFCTARLKQELRAALNLNNINVLLFFRKQNIFRLLDPEILMNNNKFLLFEKLNDNITFFNDYLDKNKIWLIYLAAIVHELPAVRIEGVLEKLFLTNHEQEIVLEGIKLAHQLKETPLPESPSEVYNLFHSLPPEVIILSTFFRTDEQLCGNIKKYFDIYSQVSINTNGKTLIDLGMLPGPAFSVIMKKLIELKLDGEIISKEQELEYIQKHYL